MTLLKALGIDKYTTSFKTWISNKFIAKGGLKTINNESIEGKGNIEVQANAEMVLPESVGLTNIETTNESRVIRAFYNIQNDEFTIRGLNDEIQPLRFWILNKAVFLGQILNITIVNGDVRMYHCVAKINLFTATVQFNYLDTHYTLTWNADTQSWDVTKTPINTGADWNAQEGEAGYIENRTHYLIGKTEYILGNGINKVPYRGARTIKFGNTIQELPVFENNLEIEIVSGPPIYVKYTLEAGEHYINLIDNYNYFTNTSIEFYHGAKTIDNVYLPNTILKTTPQTLSDEDKNQVKENLGLGEVATKQELSELSAEVSGLSEKIENLPSGESSVFEAVYGVTTYNEIIEAHNEGKIVICQDGVWITRLTRVQATQVQFQCSSFPNVTRLTCSDANVWSRGSFNVEHNMETLANGNVKIKIATQTAEVATPQYVENLLGTIINRDY